MVALFKALETKLGLPKLDDVVSLASGETGKRVDRIVSKLILLSKDSKGTNDAIALLEIVERLDKQGTLERLIDLLDKIGPLTKGKTALLLVQKLEKMEKLLATLLKE